MIMPYISQPWDDRVDSEYMINNSDVFISFFSGKYKSRRNDKTYSGPIFFEKLPVFIALCG